MNNFIKNEVTGNRMQLLKIQNIWFFEGWSAPEFFLTLAIISTLLLTIFLLYSLFSEESEPDKSTTRSKLIKLESRTVLLFFTTFSWAAAISSYFSSFLEQSLLYGAISGVVVVSCMNLWARYTRKALENGMAASNMGKVSQSIPPNRAGIGKVYTRSNRLPVELDAITIGRELPVGVPVRIVDMLDEHTAVVEPVENRPGGFEEGKIKK